MNLMLKIIRFILNYLILLTLAGFSSFSQTIEVTGKVTDSLQNPLEYTNLLVIPDANDVNIRFAITDGKGEYKLKLDTNQTYQLTVSYLGYVSQTISIETKESDFTKNFTLLESTSQLDEININYTPPVTVKQDTIIYLADKFVDGSERKLREVLKKLPGVEVDREGNVTANGKKVTKVLVEGKTFFTGDSKLAVNNIPADAVDQVEILDNYSEVAMLKGLQDSDQMAMNIKLKEDKKKFAFGDIEVGTGIKERYVAHPSLFYYSPRTNVNLIGDINNTGVKSFTFKDYIEFEGGFGKLIDDISGFRSLYNSDFSTFLNNQDFKESSNRFGALNIRQSMSKSTDINGYVIAFKTKTDTESNTLNEYLNNSEPFVENRNTTNSLDNDFLLGKITLDYEPSFEEDFSYNSFVKITNNDSNGLVTTTNPSQNNTIQTVNNIKDLNLKQNVSYSRKLTKDHTGTLETTYVFQNDKPYTNWLTNQEILQSILPVEEDEVYNIQQTVSTKSHSFNAIVKDYWTLNNFNHLYTSVGANLSFSDYFTEDLQQLSNSGINSFSQAGFNNDFEYNLANTFIGLEYKFMIGKVTFKPSAYYHFYSWETEQDEDRQAYNKALLLPQFTTKVELNNSEKINLKYALNARFPTIDRLANNYMVSSFNSVFRGNETLENQLYHSILLSYYKFSLFKGLNIHASISYNKKKKSFKNTTQLDGIEQYSTPILFERPENTLFFNGSISKKISKIRYKISTRLNYADFYQILNQETRKNISKGINATIGVETFFKEFPNIEIKYTKEASDYDALGEKTTFGNGNLFVGVDYYFLNNFVFKADYDHDLYQNKSAQIKNRFDNLNASLFYLKEDNPWGFEVSVSNLFDTKYKQSNSFSSFLISDTKTYIMPRIIMFKVSYKL